MNTVEEKRFKTHTIETAPEASRPTLDMLYKTVGMIPNLALAMSTSPKLIEGFVTLRRIFHESSFRAQERELIALVNAIENGCDYCRAIHSTIGLSVGLGNDAIAKVRSKQAIGIARLDALVIFARSLVNNRGWVKPTEIDAFLEAGFTETQVLELVLGLAVSVMANYSAHITHPELDDALQAQA